MRWKTYGPFASVMVAYVLIFVFTMIAERNFNEDMNEDIGSFVSTFESAQSESDRAQALRTVLIHTKQNTSSLLRSTVHAISISVVVMVMAVLNWARMRTDGEKGGSAEKDRSAKDEEST